MGVGGLVLVLVYFVIIIFFSFGGGGGGGGGAKGNFRVVGLGFGAFGGLSGFWDRP